MSNIKETILQKYKNCQNESERLKLIEELSETKSSLRYLVLAEETNLRKTLDEIDRRLDSLIFRRVYHTRPNRFESLSLNALPELPALFGHLWGLLMLRSDAHERATQELRAARAGKESILHEFRREMAAEIFKEPNEIECKICGSEIGFDCTNKIIE